MAAGHHDPRAGPRGPRAPRGRDRAHESFNYALFDAGETELLGCVYIDPPAKAGADAEVSWWVVDKLVGSEVEDALDELVPRWLAEEWPLKAPRYVGRDLSWQEWLALPDADAKAPTDQA